METSPAKLLPKEAKKVYRIPPARKSYNTAVIYSISFASLFYGVAKNVSIWTHQWRLLLAALFVAAIAIGVLWLRRKAPIYLLELSVFLGDESLQTSKEFYYRLLRKMKCSEESIQFQEKIIRGAAISDRTIFPPNLVSKDLVFDQGQGFKESLEESKLVIFPIVRDALAKSGLDARKIDVLVVNCSCFCPTPSLSALIVNEFGMRSDIKTFNLGGMGCSAGLISIDLAKDVLRATTARYALVVSSENMSENFYRGPERSMQLSNTLFRVGGAAVVLTTEWSRDCKLQLVNLVRTHLGRKDECYNCVSQAQDVTGTLGLRISKRVTDVAGVALKENIARLGPKELPVSEQLRYLLNYIARGLLRKTALQGSPVIMRRAAFSLASFLFSSGKDGKNCPAWRSSLRSLACLPEDKDIEEGDKEGAGKSYMPDFTKAFDHFCIHAGGKKVIDGVEKSLNLGEERIKASRWTLYNFGNTSSSSIWYELYYHFKYSKVKKDEKIWQIAFGSGFKCNSGVWKCVNDIENYGK